MENLANLTITNRSNLNLHNKRRRKNRKMFAVLALTNGFFLVSSLGYGILSFSNAETENQYSRLTSLKYRIVAYLNNSLNFVFYGIFSEKFRSFISKWFHAYVKRRPKQTTNDFRSLNSTFAYRIKDTASVSNNVYLQNRRNALVVSALSSRMEKHLSYIVPDFDIKTVSFKPESYENYPSFSSFRS
jgi:hypothetical protein